MEPDCRITVRNTSDLIAVTPYLVGFHPSDSVVVIGMVGPAVVFAARHDLLAPGDDDGGSMAAVVAVRQLEAVSILGFGPPGPVGHTVRVLAEALRGSGVRILDRVRITAGRWWSYDCTDPACCPPDGRPVPAPDTAVAASAVFQGQVALPSRKALVAQVAGVQGEQRELMRSITAGLRARAPRSPERIKRAGCRRVRMAEERYASGRILTLQETAELGLSLDEPAVFAYAVERTGEENWRVALWTDVTRRVEPAYVAPAAALLSYAAWRAGLGSLARVAIDRALRNNPGHRFSWALDRLLAAGVSHELFDGLYEVFEDQPGLSL